MPRSAAPTLPPQAAAPSRHLRLVPDPPLRVADVALFYGERSGGIRTYLDAKAAWAASTDVIEHELIVPGPSELHERGRHELPSLRIPTGNGYRWPLGAGKLRATLERIRPDVVMIHDPFWWPGALTLCAQRLGARVLAVHHATATLDAAGMPGLRRPWEAAFRAWFRHAYAGVDGIVSVVDPEPDCGRPATMPLRLGLDPAFAPVPGAQRGDEVVYVGRIAREKGVLELICAAAASPDAWPVVIHGTGPGLPALRAMIERHGLRQRVSIRPFLKSRAELARRYATAACVVMPGRHETFGLVALEAAACGTPVVACETAPSAQVAGSLVDTFEPGSVEGLLAAIARARARPRDLGAAAALAAENSWARLLEAELADLRRAVL